LGGRDFTNLAKFFRDRPSVSRRNPTGMGAINPGIPPRNNEGVFTKKYYLIDQVAAALDITYIVQDLGKTYVSVLNQNMGFPTLERNGISIDQIEAILSSRQADPETAAALS
jgi:hypothetical protein